jgi:hypothetical protein
MTTIHFLRRTAIVVAFALAGGLVLPSLISVTLADTPPAEWDGLVRVQNRSLDHIYLLPDVSFTGYTRVRLDPVEVSFYRNWNPRRSPSQRLRQSDLENIKSNLANEFRRVLSDTLTRAGYKLVDEDGDDVLRVQAAIVNLVITAPSAGAQPGSRTFVANTGQMTLGAPRLRDRSVARSRCGHCPRPTDRRVPDGLTSDQHGGRPPGNVAVGGRPAHRP